MGLNELKLSENHNLMGNFMGNRGATTFPDAFVNKKIERQETNLPVLLESMRSRQNVMSSHLHFIFLPFQVEGIHDNRDHY